MRFVESEWGAALDLTLRLEEKPVIAERRFTRNGVARHYMLGDRPIVVEVAQDGTVSVFCLCQAGLESQPCAHAAACLITSGHLRPPMTLERREQIRERGRRALALLNDEDENEVA